MAKTRTCVAMVFIFGVGLGMVSCVTSQPPNRSRFTPEKERLALLRQQFKEQQGQIANLQDSLSDIQLQLKHQKAKLAKLRKSRAKKKKGTQNLEPIAVSPIQAPERQVHDEEEQTVATSRHENMNLYYSGYRLIQERQYEKAANILRRFLKLYPDHVYADRAAFLIAEANFLFKEYGLVVIDAGSFEKRYPYSFKLPDILWRRALAFVGLGQPKEATATLQRLIKHYPESEIAAQATKKLASLSKGVMRPTGNPSVKYGKK